MFDPVIHQPVRTRIMALLQANEFASFKDIKNRLELTDGNLSSHMNTLEKEGYIEVEKYFEQKRPKTVFHLSKKGRKAFLDYIETLKNFIDKGGEE